MKKVLAWAVALALVLSSFTMAFAADAAKTSKDFKDASQINYTEAVDVMVATGIINGFPDGTFGPQKTVTRGQMAKMIACIKNGGEDVGDQFKSACPFADSKDHWAAGYIAYCASEHIIDGRSADKFDPDAEVTGTEVAKMALTSLGYDSKIQGYTGENWAAAVLKDAKKNNLFKDLDKSFVPGDPCDRESAAQILFNMLKATEVEYNQKMSVSTGETSVEVSGKATEVENKTASDNGDQKMQMYEDVFGGKLVLTPKVNTAGTPVETVTDEYGNPGHTWTYDKAKVGTYTDSTAYEFVVEKVEGADNTAKVKAAFQNYDKDAAENAVIADVKVNNGANATVALGDKVKLYETTGTDETKAYYNAVVTQYVPAKITAVNTKVSDAEKKDGITAKLTLQMKGATVATTTTMPANNKMAGYDETTYVKDAIIAVALGSNNTIIDSYLPKELVSGAVAEIDGAVATFDGKEYTKSGVFYDFGTPLAPKKEYTVYDYNGYMFASEFVAAPAAEKFYGVITDKKSDTDSTGWSTDDPKVTNLVRIFTAEGQMKEFTLAEGVTVPDAVIDANSKKVIPTLIAYEENENGEISKFYTNATTVTWENESIKTGGVLHGKQVSEDVIAFANIGTEKPEWKTYDFAALEAAKDKIDVSAYFDEETGIVAMMVGTLEDAAAPNVTLAFMTDMRSVQNTSGDAYKIDVLEKGEAKTYTSVGSEGKTAAQYTAIDNFYNDPTTDVEIAGLVKLTFDGELVSAIEFADCYGVAAPVKEFPTIDGSTPAKKYDAVFKGAGTSAVEGILPVNGVTNENGQRYLNIGTKANIDNQTITTDAVVYFVNGNKLEASEFSNIEEGCSVILMQLNEGSSTWDTVIFAGPQA